MQSEIRGRVYGKIPTNAILTFNFFSDRREGNRILLVRLSEAGKSFLEGFHFSMRADCRDKRQDVAGPRCSNVGLFYPLLYAKRTAT